ncbi:MAG: triphosphoribosyl-dephospho-CoA synthase [Planctomycetales bacterium]|nr:triphosphoribosyl-dephospho-CoA synthase [Planctomycetales bacterium]
MRGRAVAASPLSIGQCATLACVLEATAAKPGNVHRGADFHDMSYFDFLASGIAIAPAMEAAGTQRLGQTVLAAIAATRAVVSANTNLGIVLLLSPLAAAKDLSPVGVQAIVDAANIDDTRDVYRAIRLAKPGGMGRAEEQDVRDEPTLPLVAAMRLAEDRDAIARQYVCGFADIWRMADWLADEAASSSLAAAIVRTQLRVLAEMPDSLIMRKGGPALAQQASDRAAELLSRGRHGDESYEQGLRDFDFWLRADGNRRNPGTTADLITAALFALLRAGRLPPPFSFYTAAAL